MVRREELKEDRPGGGTVNSNWMYLITLSHTSFSGITLGSVSGLVFLSRGAI
jgi:hypothetical protein